MRDQLPRVPERSFPLPISHFRLPTSHMAAIGERNALRVVRETKSGVYLDGDKLGDILLPGRYVPKGTVPGDYLEVFVHHDSEDRLVATTEIPRACAGE